MRRCAFTVFVLLVACHQPPPKMDGAAQIADATVDAADAADDASTDAADDVPANGRYTQGVYSCCAKGEGISCCPPDSLPDPTIGRTATCFPYGGAYEDCVPEGGELEAKVICAICCPGLMRLQNCGTNFPSVFLCGACGDGVCGPGEMACNCPADCS